jgi:hypothetical protein
MVCHRLESNRKGPVECHVASSTLTCSRVLMDLAFSNPGSA